MRLGIWIDPWIFAKSSRWRSRTCWLLLDMPALPHSLSGTVPIPSKRHLTVVPRGLPGAALHTVSKGPLRTQIVDQKTVRSFCTNFPGHTRPPTGPAEPRSPTHGTPGREGRRIHYLIST